MSPTPDEPAAATTPDPRYPIGRFARPPAGQPISAEVRAAAVQTLADFPEHLRNAVSELGAHQLDTPYREGGWTVRQLVHHIADSHMNCSIRIRLALTEPHPTIKPYDESAWAQLHDYAAPPEWSLELIEALHARWVMLLNSLAPEQWQRTFHHPESGPMTVEVSTLLYAWHSRHHLAHITHLRIARDW